MDSACLSHSKVTFSLVGNKEHNCKVVYHPNQGPLLLYLSVHVSSNQIKSYNFIHFNSVEMKGKDTNLSISLPSFLKVFKGNFTFVGRVPKESYLEFLRINFQEVWAD